MALHVHLYSVTCPETFSWERLATSSCHQDLVFSSRPTSLYHCSTDVRVRVLDPGVRVLDPAPQSPSQRPPEPGSGAGKARGGRRSDRLAWRRVSVAVPGGSGTDSASRSAQRGYPFPCPPHLPHRPGVGGAAPWVGPICLKTSIVLFSYDETNTYNSRKFRTYRKA